MTVLSSTRVLRALVFVCALFAPTALATSDAEAQEGLDQAARLTFEEGSRAFSRGDYEEALRLFRQSHDLSPHPLLLYNIATALDRLRRDEEALEAFRSYIEADPDAEDRQEVEARILQLEDIVASRQTNDPPPPVVTPESSGLHPAIVFAGAGATLVAGGLTLFFGLRTVSLNDKYEDYVGSSGATLDQAESRFDDANRFQLMTNVMIGVTAAFGVATGVLAIFTDWGRLGGSSSPTEAAAAPTSSFRLEPIAAANRQGGQFGLRIRY